MSAAASQPPAGVFDLAQLAQLGVIHGTAAVATSLPSLSLDWPELDDLLPDHGLPRGVVELASPVLRPSKAASSSASIAAALRGGATTIALAAIRAAQRASKTSWCAWIVGPESPMLYAPALVQAGVDLDRLLVVKPGSARALARTAVKVAASGAFDIAVVDAFTGLGSGSRSENEALVVRKLALAAEEKGTSSLLLSSTLTPRPAPWPVALRLEVERRPEAIAFTVTKDRRGRASSKHVVRLAS